MTSKSSFLASIKENQKRRIWVILLMALFYVLGLPTITALVLSSTKNSYQNMNSLMTAEEQAEKCKFAMMEAMNSIYGQRDVVLLVLTVLVAIVIGIQGFSYLYHRNKIDFYMAMPVKRSRRFLTIWSSSFLIYLIPSAVGYLLGLLIGALNGVVTLALVKEAMFTYFQMLLVFAGCYHIAILAVILTGNVIITCLGCGVLFSYELIARAVLHGYQELFFKQYSYVGKSEMPYFLPPTIFYRYVTDVQSGKGNLPLEIIQQLLFATIIGILAYRAYLSRPAEAAGKSMAFPVTKPIIKILIGVLATLAAGLVISEAVNYQPLWGRGNVGIILFSMLIVLIVICCFIQVIYEFDIRGVLHRKRDILITIAICGVFMICFKYDITGYDSYIPNADKVSSAVLISPYEYNYYGGYDFLNDQLQSVGKDTYMLENMYLTDIGAINKLAKKSVELLKDCKDLNKIYDAMNADPKENDFYALNVVYRMNSKRIVSRQIYVNLADEETCNLLERITGSAEYTDVAYRKKAENAERILLGEGDFMSISAAYGDTVYDTKISKEDCIELLAQYKKDVEKLSFMEMRKHIPCGSLRIEMEKKDYTYSGSYYLYSEFKIYPFMKNTIACLKEKGYYRDGFLNTEDVERIVITNYNYVESDNERDDVTAEEERDRIVRASYDREQDIADICSRLYPSGWIYRQWSADVSDAENYNVEVYFKQGSEMEASYGGFANYSFLADDIPDFVVKDTEFHE